MENRINIQQKQKNIQHTIQFAKVLQMDALEFNNYILELCMENPIIEFPEGYFHVSQNYTAMEDNSDIWNTIPDNGETKSDYLWQQMLTFDFSEQESNIVRYMTECIDTKGYFDGDLENIAAIFKVDEKKVENLLGIIQMLDPPGIGARNLQECLIIQLERSKEITPVLRVVIASYLEALSQKKFRQIANELNVASEEISLCLDKIKNLNPMPGNSFNNKEECVYQIPDVIVTALADQYDVTLNVSLYKNIEMSSYYYRLYKEMGNEEISEYLQNKIRQAEWIRTCVTQRNETLKSISTEIVLIQKKFFDHGHLHLRPMKLNTIAQTLRVNESTVSRAVKGKYLKCKWGVFPLSYFLKKGLMTNSEEGSITIDKTKRILEKAIKDEDASHPLSDRILTEKMNKAGINITRRTVAKYRQEMGIGDTRQRKNN